MNEPDLLPMAVTSEVPSDQEEPGLYRWLVWILGAIAMVALIGIIVASLLERPVDAGLAALGGMAVGALASPLNPRK